MMKTTGLNKIKSKFSLDFTGILDNYLLKTAERLRKLSISRQAVVTGEMVKETTAFMTRKGVATVAVNVPYGAYNHQGERADGSRVIKNRTSPGQKHFLVKSAQELDLSPNVEVILKDLSKKLL
jgi:hypothetical protein